MRKNNRVSVVQFRGAEEEERHVQLPTFLGHLTKRQRIWIVLSITILLLLTIISTSVAFLYVNNRQPSRPSTSIESTTTSSDLSQANRSSTATSADCSSSCALNVNSKWQRTGKTLAGGHGKGHELNQFDGASSIDLDNDNQCMYISDPGNDRVLKWQFNATKGQIIAGGNRRGQRLDQLNRPRDAVRKRNSDALIVCDHGNARVMRSFLRNDRPAEILLADIFCWGLAEDPQGYLYVSDVRNHQVIRWQEGATSSRETVAGGNGRGSKLNQLNTPGYIFVDSASSVYVVDEHNSRIVKWMRDRTAGVLLVDHQTIDETWNFKIDLSSVFVDQLGIVYFSDSRSNHIARWVPETNKGTILIGSSGLFTLMDALIAPSDFSFDQQGNLYVVNEGSDQISRFDLDRS